MMTTPTADRPTYSMRVQVGDTWHGDEDTLRVVLEAADGETVRLAEVQVAMVHGGLVIIASGEVHLDRDTRGFARLRISPE